MSRAPPQTEQPKPPPLRVVWFPRYPFNNDVKGPQNNCSLLLLTPAETPVGVALAKKKEERLSLFVRSLVYSLEEEEPRQRGRPHSFTFFFAGFLVVVLILYFFV
eukprot:TRINITY_DN574_c0_g3_i1.p1 TRINITY_DN574_c0_g3~~TRINITY_DN574_c0_g3_i1.p1  ORF type:complete len:105 (-),score=15.08 TRINITY_DN574_c0_g3_i1:188-502(-)